MPPGPGYKEFFPAATRAAKNKATEREKARTTKPSGSPPDLNGRATLSLQNQDDESSGTSARLQRDGSYSDNLRPIADEVDSVAGDIPHTVGSASSNESSSTVFSSSAAHQTLGPASKPKSASLTPLTAYDSPSSRYPPLPAQSQSLAPQDTESVNGTGVNNSSVVDGSSTPHSVLPHAIKRRPIIDPTRPATGVKCIYDPANDASLSSNEKRTKKPIFKEFGLVRTHTISYTPWWRGSIILSVEAFG
jgi:histone-lysine N-methyltransferase SETD1